MLCLFLIKTLIDMTLHEICVFAKLSGMFPHDLNFIYWQGHPPTQLSKRMLFIFIFIKQGFMGDLHTKYMYILKDRCDNTECTVKHHQNSND